MKSAQLSRDAELDLLEATRWITKDNPAAARALRRAVTEVAIILGEHPYVGSLRPGMVQEPYRCLALTGFPYVIVYHADHRPPLIVRILHGARDLPELLRDL